MNWKDEFLEILPKLGHRNWIVVADAAYPMQAKPGIDVLISRAPLDECLHYVLEQIDETAHVVPKVLLDSELSVLNDELCPGASAVRESIYYEIGEYDVEHADHEVILEKLNMEGANYSVLVIKTESKIPYTSVFLRLDCGYWDKGRESILRSLF